MIAALFVEPDGVYANLPHVDPWPEDRDARRYSGPYPVVAHPPCQRWGRYWFGGPNTKERKELGADNGCFSAALQHVRRYGGVIEHPAHSYAWSTYGLFPPRREGGWVLADVWGGVTCHIEQGWYGHKARKATWLYVYGASPPELHWGPAPGEFVRLDAGFHSKEERRAYQGPPTKRLTSYECRATPAAFRDLLISIAETAHK